MGRGIYPSSEDSFIIELPSITQIASLVCTTYTNHLFCMDSALMMSRKSNGTLSFSYADSLSTVSIKISLKFAALLGFSF